MDRCAKHPFEAAVENCRECGHRYCGECLVYSFGPKKPPFCVQCALAAAGVRRGAAVTPVRAKKDRRRFGRKSQVVEVAATPSFDDIPIYFPEGLIPGNEAPVSEIAPEVTRRPLSDPDLIDLDEPEPALVGAESSNSLGEWASSLDDGSASLTSLSGFDGGDDFGSFGGGFDSPASPSFGRDGSGFGDDGGFSSSAWPDSPNEHGSSRNDWSAPASDDGWSGAAPWPSNDDDRGSFF